MREVPVKLQIIVTLQTQPHASSLMGAHLHICSHASAEMFPYSLPPLAGCPRPQAVCERCLGSSDSRKKGLTGG